MFCKKGLSNVVAMLMLILLVFVAISIVIAFVVPMVKENLYGGTACVNYRDYFKFDDGLGYNCFLVVGDDKFYGFSVSADSVDNDVEDKVIGFEVVFASDGERNGVIVKDGEEVGDVRMLDEQLGYLKIPSPRETQTYVYKTTETISSIGIYPILKGEKEDKLCDRTDVVKINDLCEESLGIGTQ